MNPQKSAKLQYLRTIRMKELRELEPEEILARMARIRQSHQLPKAMQHFEMHRKEFDGLYVTDLHSYLARLVLHLREKETRVYTFITTKATLHRMWAIVDVDTGMIAQYNESRGRLWSFYRHFYVEDFLLAVSGYWIEIITDGGRIELR